MKELNLQNIIIRHKCNNCINISQTLNKINRELDLPYGYMNNLYFNDYKKFSDKVKSLDSIDKLKYFLDLHEIKYSL